MTKTFTQYKPEENSVIATMLKLLNKIGDCRSEWHKHYLHFIVVMSFCLVDFKLFIE